MTAPLDLSHCRVLLVDDSPSNLGLLVEALQGRHLLTLAKDGETALRLVANAPPDLILLDLLMPGLDGYEVCRRLRAEPATRELPIIFLSALGEAKSKARGFEAGGTDYITKPFEALDVQARVRSLLRGKVYQDAARASTAGELRVAHEIQRGMVPKDFAALGFRQPFDVHAVLEPAKEVGGDLYDVFPFADGRLCIVLGDVSGKGIPAALFMAITATILRATARHVTNPEEILFFVNQELARHNPTSMFVTLYCGVLDLKSGLLTSASGGHTPPVLVRRGEAPRLLSDHAGTVVGIQPDLAFAPRSLQLRPGDTLFLYTDGVTEAADREHRFFGEARLLAALGQVVGSAREMVDGVLKAVRTFAGGEAQSDDIALLALRWLPAAELTLALQTTVAEVARGYQAVQSFLVEQGAPPDAAHDVALAVEEVLSNLVRHGHPGFVGPVAVHARIDAAAIELEVRDRGVAFDPSTAVPRDPVAPPGERAAGALGLLLIKNAMDRISYRRDGAENVLVLVRDRNRPSHQE